MIQAIINFDNQLSKLIIQIPTRNTHLFHRESDETQTETFLFWLCEQCR